MDDLISRQAAFDAIESAFDRETILNRFVRKIAISAVRKLPSAQPEQRWIPVNERLPEDERYVLVTTVSGDVTEAKYWQKERFWVLKGLAIMSVTAWMPLPKPYERSDNAKIH